MSVRNTDYWADDTLGRLILHQQRKTEPNMVFYTEIVAYIIIRKQKR